MKKGAVAFLDFLGTKGIWEKYPAEKILEDVGRLQDIVEEHNTNGRKYLEAQHSIGAPDIRIHAIFISDTLALFCWYDEVDSQTTICPLVFMLGKVAANLVREAALVEFPRTLRGAISIGEFEFDRNNLIGKAVDEAAGCHEIADGALTFLTSSAQHCFEEASKLTGFLPKEDMDLFVMHELPTKNGVLSIPVLNPLAGETASEQEKIIDRMMSSFDTTKETNQKKIESIQRKKENTKEFLDKCKTN